MKNNYYLLLCLFGLFSGGVLAQNAKTYIPDNAYQKTLKLENINSKEAAIAGFGKLYNLDADNTFVGKTETSDFAGFTHQRHQQYYKGIKVEFGMLITHTRNGQVESVNGELYDAKKLNLKPTLSQQDGFNRALNFVGAQEYLWEDDNSAKAMDYVKPVGELVIFPKVNAAEIRLAYKYDIYAITPLSRAEIFVDAHTGEILYKNPIIKHLTKLTSNKEIEANAKKGEAIILGNNTNAYFLTGTAATRYSGTKSIETKLVGTNYVLNEDTRGTGSGMVTYNCGKTKTYPSTNFTNTTNTWTTGAYATNSSTKNNAALDAHWGAEMTYDFWKNIFGRNSYDDAGAQIKSYVHYSLNYDNAFWNGSVMTYGDGNTMNVLTALDVCGHEIGHGVCSFTANLAYQNQSGGMNEGLSDIWGTCIEQYGRNGNLNAAADTASPGTLGLWKIGEDIASGGLRSMSWPKTKGNPDTYKGTNWTTTADDGSCTPQGDSAQPGYNDACGVHNNSGVMNHWFYLLTIGKTNWTNSATPTRTTTTTGIGMTESSKITYFAERDYLTSNATYMDMRNATATVAKNLFGCGSTEHIAVMNCWYAVNVGVRYTDLDLNISSITGDSNETPGVSHTVSFTLENQGLPPISSGTITYSIDGGAQIPLTWTGSALTGCSNPTQNYSILLGAGTLSRGTHTVVVTVTVAGDVDTTNNSKTAYVTVNDNGTVGTVNTFNNPSDALVSIDANGKANSVWQRGTVAKTLLTNAVAGSQVYATKLTGNYPDKATSYLVSQCYNLSNMSNPAVSFDMAFDLESNWDIIYFEYSTNFGATWNSLGTSTDANWYNSSRLPDGTNCFNCIGGQWTGDYATAPVGGTGANGNKRSYSHSLSAFGFGGATPASNIIFRIVFMSDDASNQEGAFVDNFLIQGTLSAAQNQFENFGVYPNPSNGVFNVVLSTSEKVNISLYDLRGRAIYNNSFASNGSVFSKELDFSTLSSGIYILNVDSAGKKASKRIIIN